MPSSARAPVRRLQADDAVERRRNANRAAGVGAERGHAHLGGDGDWPSRRSSRRGCARPPGVARRRRERPPARTRGYSSCRSRSRLAACRRVTTVASCAGTARRAHARADAVSAPAVSMTSLRGDGYAVQRPRAARLASPPPRAAPRPQAHAPAVTVTNARSSPSRASIRASARPPRARAARSPPLPQPRGPRPRAREPVRHRVSIPGAGRTPRAARARARSRC